MSDLLIREPVEADISALRPVMQHWVRDRNTGAALPDEVAAIEESVRASIAGESEQHFLVAERAGRVLGIMGVQPPTEAMRHFTRTPCPTELITALVSDEARGSGVGRALVEALAERAEEQGSTELVVNNGPRYQRTGWPFWRRMFGEPVGTAEEYYGPGGDAKVWRKDLSKETSSSPEKPEVELRGRVSSFRDTGDDEQVKRVLDVILPDLESGQAQYLLGTASLVMKPKTNKDLKDLFVIFSSDKSIRLSVPTIDGEFEDYSLKLEGVFRNGFKQGKPTQEPVDEAGTQLIIDQLGPYLT